jgi:hypothetical protein
VAPSSSPESGEERVVHNLLIAGAVAGFLFLGWQISDYVLDASRPPEFRHNDVLSALGSLALLAFVGVISARRAQLRREATASAAPRSNVRKGAKPAPRTATSRRKRRA